MSATVGPVLRIGQILGWVAGAGLGLSVWGCSTSTEFFYEGSGQPSDRSTASVPEGVLGVCRVPKAARPVLVDETLWEHTRLCSPQSPSRFVRLGYTASTATTEGDAIKEQEKFLLPLRDGQKDTGGNNQLVSLLRNLHERGLRDPSLHDRVSRQTTKDGICDYTYLLNTMAKERAKFAKGDKCTVQAYDTVIHGEACLFNTARAEAVWLTSSWSCVAHTGVLGEEASCHRLCAYDDYCAKQVSCTGPDVDLLLCAMGVCVPQARAGF